MDKHRNITNRIDISWEASNIIMKHTEVFMSASSYEPNTEEELYDMMVQECSYLLVLDLLSHKFTPMQYNAIRNEIAKQLADVFGY